ncbi:sensor histidine kinase [Actinomadura alba]|uniref:histidine kinase n=1 Tax=Actinomadura alba TaxID=406431 RepID=A0ABR7LXW8_9ACTN|nr:sensor histidine kinase [Actinomadura alba]MBC6469696.1 sensor histidine kinase [Actinomadura alba]
MRVYWRSPAGARTLLLDCGLVAVVLGANLLMGSGVLLGTPEGPMLYKDFRSVQEWQEQVLWWWLATVPTVAAVFLRHRWPVTALALAAAGTAGHVMSPLIPHLPLDLVTLVTLFTLAGTARSRRVSVAALIAIEAGLYGINLAVTSGEFALLRKAGKFTFNAPPMTESNGDPIAQAAWLGVVPALLLAIAWAAGDNARTRRAHLATLEARAADLEREQEQRTALAVATERGRITRELHDVVAHGLSVMVVQAQGAQAALRRHPERSEVALTNVITTGRASLAEMRRLLGLVRSEPGPALTPQPSLAALPELIERVRSSGTPVAFHLTGEPATLPTGVELSAYRIIQEALTNTLKHADPGSSCGVELDFATDRLRIRVHDTGTTCAPPVFGNGLRGITERVTALGGTLHAGPADHGGFEVSTTLPLEIPA